MELRSFAALTLPEWIAPLVAAVVWIAVFSLLKEPVRRHFSAIMMAGAGAAYLNGSLGKWEFAFSSLSLPTRGWRITA